LGETVYFILKNIDSMEFLESYRARNTDILPQLGILLHIIKQHLVDEETISIIEPHENLTEHFQTIIKNYEYNKPTADIFILADACAHANSIGNDAIFIHNNPKDFESDFLKNYTKKIKLTIKNLEN